MGGAVGLSFALSDPERVAAATTRGVVASGNAHEDLRADVLAVAKRPDAGRAFEAFQRAEVGLRGLRTNFVEELPELTVPVRFVHGERDPVVSVDWAVRAATLAPGADCRVLRDCGHWAPRERPEQFLATIEALLA